MDSAALLPGTTPLAAAVKAATATAPLPTPPNNAAGAHPAAQADLTSRLLLLLPLLPPTLSASANEPVASPMTSSKRGKCAAVCNSGRWDAPRSTPDGPSSRASQRKSAAQRAAPGAKANAYRGAAVTRRVALKLAVGSGSVVGGDTVKAPIGACAAKCVQGGMGSPGSHSEASGARRTAQESVSEAGRPPGGGGGTPLAFKATSTVAGGRPADTSACAAATGEPSPLGAT